MHFQSIFLVASILGIAYAAAVPDPEAEALSAKLNDAFPLDKCACTYNNCKCKPGTKQGRYCGYCSAVTNSGNGGNWEWNFECNPDGGCCTYKTTTKCQNINTALQNCGK